MESAFERNVRIDTTAAPAEWSLQPGEESGPAAAQVDGEKTKTEEQITSPYGDLHAGLKMLKLFFHGP
jgi:hypothetical protein